jgi:CBS domain containing-hemolysin-like protein
VRARLGLGAQQTLRETLEEAVRAEIDGDSTFSATERDMLLRLLRLGGLSVEDVMVPRADIIAIEEQATVADLLRLFNEAGVSRLPVYHDTLDDPRGMVHVKDLLRYFSAAAASDGQGAAVPADKFGLPLSKTGLMRPVLNVPPSMPAVNLLVRMQGTRNHIALVVDEYGGTDGLVTIEDLVELVVGDIEDEYDVEEAANITEDARHGLVAQARTPVAELEAHLGVKLLNAGDEEDVDTLGGLVTNRLGRVPVKGEVLSHESGFDLEVLDADPRRVKRLRIRRAVPVPAADANHAAPDGGTTGNATASPSQPSGPIGPEARD